MAILIKLNVVLADRNMKLTELSEKIGIEYNRLSQIKLGNGLGIKYETLNRICKALKCTPGDILHYVEDEEPAVKIKD